MAIYSHLKLSRPRRKTQKLLIKKSTKKSSTTRVQWTWPRGQPRWWSCIHSRKAAIFFDMVNTRSPGIRRRAGGHEISSRFRTRIGTGRGSNQATRSRKKACCWNPFTQRVKAAGTGRPCSNLSRSMSWM